MSNSIFNISNWAAGISYQKNDIVSQSGLYYYALNNFTSSSSLQTDINSGNFGGITINNNETKSLWLWLPSYNNEAQFNPAIKSVKFGDQYEQTSVDGINNNLLTFNFTFEGRDNNETTAILHFLSARQGAESFVYSLGVPYGVDKRFKCKKWSHRQIFYNNHTISAEFVESVK